MRTIRTSFLVALAFLSVTAFAQSPPKNSEIYAGSVKAMPSAYDGENVRVIIHGLIVHYMTPEEKEASRVEIRGGLVYRSNGELFPDSVEGDALNYVMDEFGNLYIFNQTGHEELRHSSVLSGAPVAGAGEVEIRGHTVYAINRSSGHYDPTHEMMDNVRAELERGGIDVSKVNRL